MEENPYQAPESAPSDYHKRGLTGASITLIVLAWLWWAFIFLTYCSSVFVIAMGPSGDGTSSADSAFATTSGIVAVAMVGVVFFLRWLFFRVLICQKRLRPGGRTAAIVGTFGMMLIYILIKGVENFGLILFFQNRSVPLYLAFAIPSFILFIAFMPVWLLNKNVTHAVPPDPVNQG